MVLTDWLLLAVLLLSVLLGAWRGLVYEVLSVAGWVAAFVLAQAYADEVAAMLPIEGLSPPLQLAAGFVLVFIAVAFAGGLLAWMVKKLVASVGLRPVDRILGSAFGLARGVVMLLALSVVVSMSPMRDAPWWQGSVVADVLVATLHAIKPLLPEPVARYVA
ncbi:CvpA family protein [Hydrogenophaga sp.]|uniref:CvpA family protein n=1 Tax=Hydrogenophaga sp. TaxID=1904254 RepID=UPI002731C309|nr:CvpA family protein [Hydrogenophaga sp.]MDP2018345.1 CvpA family protein [Hydrogenophaga sp.]MDP3166837.1 CvpA family protein [Hydrogenophaga sp.]MDP3812196.1 CvpA family protein [Hydrogenophaga sp.]